MSSVQEGCEIETDEGYPEPPTPQVTLEDLSIDDSLGQFERVLKYANSHIPLQRLVHVKMLAATAQAAGYEATVETCA